MPEPPQLLDMGSFSDFIARYGNHGVYNYRVKEREAAKTIHFHMIKGRGDKSLSQVGGKSLRYETSTRIVLSKPPLPRTCWERIMEDN